MSVYTGVIDDNDGTILFSDNWELWQASTPDPRNYKSTLHSTGVPGSSARVRFTGSRVAVVSTIATGSGALSKASFSLDNGPPIPVSVVTTPPVQFQYVFWDSGPLEFGSHLLVIVNLDKQAFFRIDHIDYDPTDSNAPKVTTTPQQTSTQIVTVQKTSTDVVGTTAGLQSSIGSTTTAALASSGSGTATTSPTGTNSVSVSVSIQTVNAGTGPTATSPLASSTGAASANGALDNAAANASAGATAATRSATPIGAIAGGIAGGVLILVILGLLFFFLKRRRREQNIYLGDSSGGGGSPLSARNPTVPTPFARRSYDTSSSNLVGSRPGTLAQNNFDARYSTNDNSTISDQSMAYGGYTQGHRHQGSSGGTWGNGSGGVGARAKHAEYLGEQRQMSMVNNGHGASLQGLVPAFAGPSSLGGFPDLDAPPAYSGQSVRVLEEGESGGSGLGLGSSSRWKDRV